MKFYEWFYYSGPGMPAYVFTLDIKTENAIFTKDGFQYKYYGFMYWNNKFTFEDNLENPTHLNDEVHETIEMPHLNKQIIKNIFIQSF